MTQSSRHPDIWDMAAEAGLDTTDVVTTDFYGAFYGDIYGDVIVTSGDRRIAIGYDPTDGEWINWTAYARDGDDWVEVGTDGCPASDPAPAMAALVAFAAAIAR